MAECEHQARTTAYFDGALSPADDAVAAAHLAACASCQGILGDAVALDAVLSTAAPATVVPIRRRRWPLAVAIAGGLAVAATATVAVWPRAEVRHDALALAPERAVEARFTGAEFAGHRPLGVLRGDRRLEPISLQQLAALEARRAEHDLVAALVASGDIERARTVVAMLPADAASETDRAAVALAQRDHEGALAHAYRALALAPRSPAASWNLALAARELGLVRSSMAAFAQVAALNEPGWSDEARAHQAALAKELAAETAYPAFEARARAMVGGGAVIDAADARRFPAFARVYTLDAIRMASGARLDALRPLAAELDAATGTTTMTAAIDRAARGDAAVRAKFAVRYAAVAARTLTGTALDAFLDELRAAGPVVDDLRASAIILGDRARARIAELATITQPWRDPWFDLAVARERIRARYPEETDLRREPALLEALATCPDVWGFRCARLAQDLAQLLKDTGRADLAEPWAVKTLAWFHAAGAPVHAVAARALLAEIHRHLGRNTLARIEFEEVGLTESAGCATRRYATIALADLAYAANDWPAVRTTLATPTPPEGCVTEHELQAVLTASDLARRTQDPEDRARALAWIDAAAHHETSYAPAVLRIARARLGDAAALAELRRTAPEMARETATDSALRAGSFTTLVTEAGARGAWSEVLAIAGEEQAPRTDACAVVASLDDNLLTVAARTPAGALGAQRAIAPEKIASEQLVGDDIVRALGACPAIAVLARPPLHGRADVLPPALPWWFAGDAPAHARGAPARSLEVASPRAPGVPLPALGTAPSGARFDLSLTGAAATPARVLAGLADATYAELHVHGVATTGSDATAYLALSPDADGTFALRADALRAARFARGPIVVLAACRAAAMAPSLRVRWSLPDAFLRAGAHAVVAVDIPIPDASARRVFDDLHRRLDAGEPIEAAVAAIRRSARDELAWASHLMVFR